MPAALAIFHWFESVWQGGRVNLPSPTLVKTTFCKYEKNLDNFSFRPSADHFICMFFNKDILVCFLSLSLLGIRREGMKIENVLICIWGVYS